LFVHAGSCGFALTAQKALCLWSFVEVSTAESRHFADTLLTLCSVSELAFCFTSSYSVVLSVCNCTFVQRYN